MEVLPPPSEQKRKTEDRIEVYSSVLQMEAASSSDTSTKLYGVTSQKTGIFLLSTIKTSNLTCTNLSVITNMLT